MGEEDLDREWLDADGLGGYASGTIGGVPSRRYHGVLLVSMEPPHRRVMLVNHLAETVEAHGKTFVISPRGTPKSWKRDAALVSFEARPMPTWTYELNEIRLEKALLRVRGTNHVIVRWRHVGGAEEVTIHVRPMLTCREYDGTHDAGSSVDPNPTVAPGHVSWRPHAQFPRVHAYGKATYHNEPAWQLGIEYTRDRDRHEPHQEAWWSPGTLSLSLTPGDSTYVAFSTDDAADDRFDAETLFEREVDRREAERAPTSGKNLLDALFAAAEKYRIDMGEGSALLAGFPWFDVWTRDTFTSFGGIYLATKHFAEARRTLATFAMLISNGALPANVPDDVTKPRWNAPDASLWFIASIDAYLRATGDFGCLDAFAGEAVRALIDGFANGRAPHVALDRDGLLFASASDQPLTWMDAVCNDHIMTPRRGKPIELEALWLHALAVGRMIGEKQNDAAFVDRCTKRRRLALESFQRGFFYEAKGYCFDVIDSPTKDGAPGSDGKDETLRPNQIFALAFEDDLLTPAQRISVLHTIREKLLTPVGLRTLSPDDPRYRPRYEGDKLHRDRAYHQGTVWPYLMGPFVSAWIRNHGGTDASREEARGFLQSLEHHLDTEGCVGHLAEIFDGTAPHRPRGCFAQAWSVGELLSAITEHKLY